MARRVRVVGASIAAALLLVTSVAGPSLGRDPHAAKPMLGQERAAGSVEALAAAPSGFTDQVTLTGLNHPTVVQFAANGRVFVAEKSGLIKVFDSLSDTTATVFADLRPQVDDYWDRGLLGLAVAPNFPTSPYVYVLYTYDAVIGGTAPRWNDACPNPPGPTTDGCVVSARLSRLQANGDTQLGPEQVLINDWCQQYPSHSVGTVAFGPDGALYVSAGDGASFTFADYGQGGGSAGSPTPVNPCGDPVGEGGALRSQDVRPGPTGSSYSSTILADGPAAYWRVGEATGTSAVDEVGGRPGVYRGGLALGVPGAIVADPNTAIDFDGSTSYLQLGNDVVNDWPVGNGAFSIELWFKRASPMGTIQYLWSKSNQGNIRIKADNRLYIDNDGVEIGRSSIAITDTNWHHLVVTHANAATAVKFYVDSVDVSVNLTAGAFGTTTNSAWVGRYRSGTSDFPGAVDEVAIYSKTLTAAQVAAHNTAGTSGTGGGGGAANDPVTLDGALLRLDPATGAALPDNPNAGATDPNERRIVAYGFRNPFRFTFRPGTSELWLGDVGWDAWEEVNLIPNPAAGVTDHGWPCYEGMGRQASYDNLDVGVCERFYAAGPSAVALPYFTYNHSATVVPSETCPFANGSSISGLAFSNGGNYPASYAGGLFVSDYTRDCIWFMPALANGRPNSGQISTFVAPAANPVYLTIGPGGDLVYVDYDGGTIHRLTFSGGGGNQPPTAAPSATPTSGQVPLAVAFSGTASTDPELGALTYAWDFDGNGTDDAATATANFTYTTPGTYVARLRVTDPGGLSDSKTVTINASSTAPVPTITTPTTALTWAVGDRIDFEGGATDAEDGAIPASGLSWSIVQRHCPINPNDCHSHTVETINGVVKGFVSAPDHDYPSTIDITLTATDSGGLQGSTTVRLNPKTVTLSFATVPSGLQLTVGSTSSTAPFTRTVIQGSRNGLTALPTQTVGGVQYAWQSWSDGGTRAHDVFANASASYTATYQAVSADIRVTQSVAQSGSRVTITATGINGGPAPATAMTLTDTLPSKLGFVSATVPGGSCTYASSTRIVTCPLGTLASGAQTPVTIVTNDSGKGNVSIVARVTSSAPDANTANNTVTTNVRLR